MCGCLDNVVIELKAYDLNGVESDRNLTAPACEGSLLTAWHTSVVVIIAQAGRGSKYAYGIVAFLSKYKFMLLF